MKFPRAALYAGASLSLLAACSKPAPQEVAKSVPPQTAAASANMPAPEPVDALNVQAAQMTPIEPSVSPMAAPVDKAVWTAEAVTPEAKRNAMLRAQVLLARAHFSPGVIDGQDGGNVRNAIAAFEAAHDLPADGVMDDQVWAALSKDEQPALTDYVITADDAKGPFTAKIPPTTPRWPSCRRSDSRRLRRRWPRSSTWTRRC